MRAMLLVLVLGLATTSGCAESHVRAGVDPSADASVSEDGALDAGVGHDASPGHDAGGGGGGGPRCGPNQCRAGEICCDEACGVCAFPDECVVFDCPGPD